MDFKTLAIALSISNLLQVAALSAQWRMARKHQGIGWWALGIGFNALGFLAMFLRTVPGLTSISIFANNVFFVLGHVALYVGVMRFYGQKEPRSALLWSLGAYALVDFYFVFVYDHLIWRGSVLYLSIAGMAFLSAWTLLKYRPRALETSVRFLTLTFGLHGSMFLVGFVMAFVLPPSSNNSTSNANLGQLLGLLDGLVISMMWTFGFILMLNQRLNAENEEAGQELKLIFDASPDAVLVTQLRDGRVLEVNSGFLNMTGYLRGEAIGKSTLNMQLWKDPTNRQVMMDALLESGTCSNLEFEFLKKDGSQFTGLLSARILRLRGTEHVLNVIHDFTARKQLERKLLEQATTDGLTGVFNRRHFLELAQYEVTRSVRLNQPLSIALIDIDYFKQINDTYGHHAGDAVLVNFARICQERVRDVDLVARIGGDEFVILFPLASGIQSAEVLDRVHAGLAACQNSHSATISVGIASMPCAVETIEGLMELADQALYQAKQAGRNRSAIY